MSRGPGSIQRQVLALLSEEAATIPQMARAIFQKQDLAPAEYETVRRAVDSLAKRAVIFTVGCRRRAFRGTDGRGKLSWVWTLDRRASAESKRDAAMDALTLLNTAAGRSIVVGSDRALITVWRQILSDAESELAKCCALANLAA